MICRLWTLKCDFFANWGFRRSLWRQKFTITLFLPGDIRLNDAACDCGHFHRLGGRIVSILIPEFTFATNDFLLEAMECASSQQSNGTTMPLRPREVSGEYVLHWHRQCSFDSK
jgi:hypothetical protein